MHSANTTKWICTIISPEFYRSYRVQLDLGPDLRARAAMATGTAPRGDTTPVSQIGFVNVFHDVSFLLQSKDIFKTVTREGQRQF